MPIVTGVNTKFGPETNFYMYINHKWQAHVHIPPFHGSYGISEEIEDDVQNALLKVIDTLRKEHPRKPLSMFATSFLHTPSQRTGVVDLQRILSTYECMATPEDIGFRIGILNRLQARSPISIEIASDVYTSSKGCVYLNEAQLGLPEQDLYSEPPTPSSVVYAYSKLLSTIGKHLNLEALDSVVSIEQSILPSLANQDEADSLQFSYHPCTYNDLSKQYPSIPWDAIFRGWGYPESKLPTTPFVVTNRRYFRKLNRMFQGEKAFPMEHWRLWMRSMTILSFLEYLPPPFDDLDFELFHRMLEGNTQKMPQKYLTLKALQTFAPQDLGHLFVNHIVPKGTKSYAHAMVMELQQATIDRLHSIRWMTVPTKEKAIQKVQGMKFQIAYPNSWRSETRALPILEDRPIHNLLLLSTADTERRIQELVGGTFAKTAETWEDGVFEVNAYYYSEANMLVIPAGILRAPFFDLKRSRAWNLGGIGTAIGHEITHGFDVDGRMYDVDGNFRNWWAKEDSTHYRAMTRDLVKLFEGQEYMGGEVDGELTLSENLADVGGLAIALHALKKGLRRTTPTQEKKAYREFFTSYAISWRNKDRPTKAIHSLSQDVHAPAPLRVNLIVRQFEEFYTAFDIQPTDKGYIPVDKRIVMW